MERGQGVNCKKCKMKHREQSLSYSHGFCEENDQQGPCDIHLCHGQNLFELIYFPCHE